RLRLRRLQPCDLRLHVWIVGVVALLGDDQLLLLAESVVQAREEVLAVVVVLVENGDSGPRARLCDVPPVDRALRPIVRLVADRPRPLLGVLPPRGGAARDE